MRVLCILAASAALAQQQPPAGTVQGRVVHQLTREGIRKAAVRLYAAEARREPGRGGGGPSPGGAAETVTGADGSFRFDAVRPGSYRVMVERAGFVFRRDGRRNDPPISVTDGPVRTGDLELIPQAVVTGRITDDDGDPVLGAQVQLSRYRFIAGRRHLLPQFNASTNDLGEYRIHSIVPGKYVLSVNKGGRGIASSGPWGPPGPRNSPPAKAAAGPETQYVTTYFPGGTSFDTASPLDLVPGQEYRGADLRLSRAAVYRIRGVVSGLTQDGNRRGGPSAVVYLFPSAGSLVGAGERRPAPVDTKTGLFEIQGVRPGSYGLMVQQYGGPENRMGYATVETGESDLEGVRIQLREPVEVRGKLTLEGSGTADWSGAQILLSALGAIPVSAPAAKAAADGSFRLTNASPARFRVTIPSAPDGYWVKSIQWGGRPAEDAEIDLSTGAASELTIQMAPGAGSVEGAVRDSNGDPVTGVKVTLAPEGKFATWWELYREVEAGAGGSFSFPNLPPGSYRVYAWTSIEPGAYQDPDFLKGFATQSSPVSVETNGRVTVHPKPIALPGKL